MNSDLNEFQAMLVAIRSEFLNELPERCDALEKQILRLERTPDDQNAFDELYRIVHSLKGSGGTHGLSILSMICHEMENLMESKAKDRSNNFAPAALALVDLIREVETIAGGESPNYSQIEQTLDRLRISRRKSRKAVLVVETSAVMTSLYRSILAETDLEITIVNSGLSALEHLLQQPYDCVVIGRELQDIDGVAISIVLRYMRSKNRDLPIFLITNNHADIPESARIYRVLARDVQLGETLLIEVNSVCADD